MVKYFFLTRLFTYIIHQGFCTFHVYYNNITTQQKSTQDIGHTLQYRSAATVPNESCPMRVIVYLSKHCSSAMVFGFRQYIHEIRKCSNHHTVFDLNITALTSLCQLFSIDGNLQKFILNQKVISGSLNVSQSSIS